MITCRIRTLRILILRVYNWLVKPPLAKELVLEKRLQNMLQITGNANLVVVRRDHHW
jgi:hypothetical protein